MGAQNGVPQPQDSSGHPTGSSENSPPPQLAAPGCRPGCQSTAARPQTETGCTGLRFAIQTPTQPQVSRDKSTITYCPSSRSLPSQDFDLPPAKQRGTTQLYNPPPLPGATLDPTRGTTPARRARPGSRSGCSEAPEPGRRQGWDAGRALEAEAGGGRGSCLLAMWARACLVFFFIYL